MDIADIIIGVLAVLAGLALVQMTTQNRRNAKLLTASGAETTATITKSGREGSDKVYRTHYTYTVNGQTYKNYQDGNFQRLAINGLLRIRYLPTKPKVHEVLGTQNMNKNADTVKLIFGIIFVVGGIALVLFG